jgi:hypothetical protein
LTPLTVCAIIPFMTNTICGCGKAKAERAAACFDCLAKAFQPQAYVKVAIGEPGPKFYAVKSNGACRRFATHQAACEWAGVA